MKTLDKINAFIDKIDEKKKNDYKPSEWLKGNRKVGGKEYDDFFKDMLKKWKIKSYKDLSKDKQDAFFKDVQNVWNVKGKGRK